MASESLKLLLEKVHQGKVVLPEFQRDFVWTQASVIKLMTSIFNGYPIGSLLLMENNDAYQYRLIEGVPGNLIVDSKDQDLVLDGQQRLTSCYRAFYGHSDIAAKSAGRYYFNYGQYVKMKMDGESPDGSSVEELFEFFKYSVTKKKFNSMAAEISAGLMPLDIILQENRGYTYAKWLNQYNFSEAHGQQDKYDRLSSISSEFLVSFIERVTGYQVNFEKITRDTNPDVICTIFETINTTGVKLTVFDLLVAKCFKANVNLRDMLEAAVEDNEWIRRYDPSGKEVAAVQLPRILGQMITRECKKGVILGLDALRIYENWHRAVKGLNDALCLLYNRYGAVTLEQIPSTDVIAPLAVVMIDHRIREEHLANVDKWYWRSVFGQYFRGAPETKISRTVRELLEEGWLFGEGEEPEAVSSYQFPKSSISEANKNTILYKGLMALMISRDPYDIGAERRRLRECPDGEIHDHHIFPQKFLKDNGIKGTDANQILNRMPIWKSTNESIGSLAPHVYVNFPDRCNENACQDLERFYFVDPLFAREEFSRENYELFLDDRRERFIELIKAVTFSENDNIVETED